MARILILDDDPRRHVNFCTALQGHQVVHVWNYEDCVEVLRDFPTFDLVYLDHDLEGINWQELKPNGYNVCQYITSEMDPAKWPTQVIVHSLNPPRAWSMVRNLFRAGIPVTYEPYRGEDGKLLDDPELVTGLGGSKDVLPDDYANYYGMTLEEWQAWEQENWITVPFNEDEEEVDLDVEME